MILVEYAKSVDYIRLFSKPRRSKFQWDNSVMRNVNFKHKVNSFCPNFKSLKLKFQDEPSIILDALDRLANAMNSDPSITHAYIFMDKKPYMLFSFNECHQDKTIIIDAYDKNDYINTYIVKNKCATSQE